MKLNELSPTPGSIKNTKRRGRGHGSGLGKSSGRGNKGAGQRSGFKRRPWFEGGQMPLARRLPIRGFNNNFRKEFQIVNLSAINNLELENIDAEVLFEHGLISSALKPIKLLGDGNISFKVDIIVTACSKSAKEKIEKVGGSITLQ